MNIFDEKNREILIGIDNAVKIAETMAKNADVKYQFDLKGKNIIEVVENYIDDIFKGIEEKTGKSWNQIRDDFNKKIIGDNPKDQLS